MQIDCPLIQHHGRATPRWRISVAAVVLLLVACQPPARQGENQPQPPSLPTGPSFIQVEPGVLPASEPPGQGSVAFSVVGSTQYELIERLRVVNRGPGSPEKQNLWIALVSTVVPYQEVHTIDIAPGGFRLLTDELGNRYAEFDFGGMPPDSDIAVEIRYSVTVNALDYDLADCHGPVPDVSVDAELHIESDNPQIQALAGELSQGKVDACQQIRAFYDYVGTNLTYSYNGENWGAQAALGPMGADCTEYAALTAALSRAVGLPAEYLQGVTYLSGQTANLGRVEHAWLEVYLPHIGWTPMDPTFGRLPALRDTYFARLTPDHIIVTRGSNPSVLRGSSYFTHLYWPGDSTSASIEDFSWTIVPAVE